MLILQTKNLTKHFDGVFGNMVHFDTIVSKIGEILIL